MIQSIHYATQGMTFQMHKQDQIANNLANINTTGFKRSDLFAKAIHNHMVNDRGQVSPERTVRADERYIDFSTGMLQDTGRDLDVALDGDGFFTVMTPNGIRYTRDGHFALDTAGYLVTSTGDRVFGDDGFIRVQSERGAVTILETGSVIQDGVEIDKLRISDFPRPYNMLHTGAGYLRPEVPASPIRRTDNFLIKQGFLETSNVEGIEEMTSMIRSQRIYEALSNAIKTEDETLGKTVTLGRVD